MLRTRDFLLFLLSVGFLVLAIVTTYESKISNNKPINPFDSSVEEKVYSAEVVVGSSINRGENLSDMQDKIAQKGVDNQVASVISAIENPVDTTEELVFDETENDDSSLINNCANQTLVGGSWVPQPIEFKVVEGARLVYKAVDSTVDVDINQDILLQLPLRSGVVGVKNCIPQDVVGIALDGSLIRNNEHGVYGVFGGDTLVGYALDGFPIYGLNNAVKTDKCGGTVIAGQYKYFLNTEREGVLGCFSGTPIRI